MVKNIGYAPGLALVGLWGIRLNNRVSDGVNNQLLFIFLDDLKFLGFEGGGFDIFLFYMDAQMQE